MSLIILLGESIYQAKGRTVLYRSLLTRLQTEQNYSKDPTYFQKHRMLSCFRAEWFRREVWNQPWGPRVTSITLKTPLGRIVAYMSTWQAKNENYFKNVLLGRRLNLIAKWRRSSLASFIRSSRLSQSTFFSCQSTPASAGSSNSIASILPITSECQFC